MWQFTKVFMLQIIGIMLLCGISPGHSQGVVSDVLGAITSGLLPGHRATRNYTFVLEESWHSRLCTNKSMLTINGQFPGPTIYARRGDLVIVNLINRSNHSITIHWHGVKMPRSPWWDGPEYVTQCPVTPGTNFTQRVVLSDEEGTLWWHAHSEWSRNSVFGALIILPEKGQSYPFPEPAGEVPITLGEWWNRDVQEVMEDFLTNGDDPETSNAFLINGQPGDLHNCSRQETFRYTVKRGKTYLFRLVNAVMNNIMFCGIANHNVTIVGTDAAYVKQFSTDYIAISPGQTIDFLLTANQPSSHYYLACRVYASAGNFLNATTTAIIQYAGNYTPPTSPLLPNLPAINDTGSSVSFTRRFRSLANAKYPIDVPLNITEKLLYTLSINLRPCVTNCTGPLGERLLASLNNITMVLPNNSIINDYYYENISGVYDSEEFPDNPPLTYNYTQQFVPIALWRPQNGTAVNFLDYNATVELVFQGTNSVTGIDHPMHLHGYSFYVVGSGFGNFNATTDPLTYNLVDPPSMETIAVPPRGWTAIRFKANNPGVWFMHCHFERHASWGMGMTFIVRDGKEENEKMLPPPPDMPRCSA